MSHYLSMLLFFPLAGALVLLLVPRERERVVRLIAGAAALGSFLLSIPLWFWYDTTNPAFQFAERSAWIPSIGAEYFLGVDGFSALLILLTTLIGLLAILSSWAAIADRVKAFYIVVLVLQAGMLGALMALDALLFFLFFEVMLVPMYFLINIWGGTHRFRSAIPFVLGALAGSAVTLGGILTLYFYSHSATGVYSFDVTRLYALSIPFDVQWRAFLALFVGFAIAVTLFPLHAWLADADADAPAARLVILAVMLEMGAYGLIRFSLPILPDATRWFAPYLALLCIAGIVYCGLAALARKDWTRLVACFAVSQMALAMLGLFALNPLGIAGSMIQQLNHGISTGALFLMIGVISERRLARDVAALGGAAKVMPIFAAVFLLMTLSSIGLPTLNGFVGQYLILQGLLTAHTVWAVCAAGGIALGAVGMLNLYERIMFGVAENAVAAGRARPDLSGREMATLAPLIVLAVWIGVYPKPFLDRLEMSVQRVVARVSPEYPRSAAECDPTVTPAMRTADPAAQFLQAAPCGPDGEPLPPTPPAPLP